MWESLKAKHYIFVGVVGVGCFSIQCNSVGGCLSQKCSSFKWDLVGCWGLNTKKNEKKNYANSLQGGSAEKRKELCGW